VDQIMDTAMTAIQVILGLLMIVGGLAKLILPYAKYSRISAVAWSKDFKPGHIKLLGVLEVCGGVGLIVPMFLHSLTMLIPLAAVGIALYMSGAIATHLRRSEYPHMIGILIVFLVPALLVAYGRLVGFAV
jgi:maltodextrin utilization protein YvdJ